MRETFDRMMPVTFKVEGGYVNNKHDNGGPTNLGVTLSVFNAWRKRNGRPGGVQELKKLTRAEASDLYRAQYWTPIRGDELPLGLDFAVFDISVNSGPSKAVQLLQQTVDANPDRHFGEKTLVAALSHFRADEAGTIRELCHRRLEWMKKLSDWRHFGKGWTRRVNEVRVKSIQLAASDDAAPIPPLTAMGSEKARPEDVAVIKTTEGQVAAGTVGAGTIAIGSEVGESLIENGTLLGNYSHLLPWLGIVAGVLVLAGVAYIIYRQVKRRKEGAL